MHSNNDLLDWDSNFSNRILFFFALYFPLLLLQIMVVICLLLFVLLFLWCCHFDLGLFSLLPMHGEICYIWKCAHITRNLCLCCRYGFGIRASCWLWAVDTCKIICENFRAKQVKWQTLFQFAWKIFHNFSFTQLTHNKLTRITNKQKQTQTSTRTCKIKQCLS